MFINKGKKVKGFNDGSFIIKFLEIHTQRNRVEWTGMTHMPIAPCFYCKETSSILNWKKKYGSLP